MYGVASFLTCTTRSRPDATSCCSWMTRRRGEFLGSPLAPCSIASTCTLAVAVRAVEAGRLIRECNEDSECNATCGEYCVVFENKVGRYKNSANS